MNLKDAVASGRRYRRKSNPGWWPPIIINATAVQHAYLMPIADAIANDWEVEEPKKCGAKYDACGSIQICEQLSGHTTAHSFEWRSFPRVPRRWKICEHVQKPTGQSIWCIHDSDPMWLCNKTEKEKISVIEILTCVCGHENIDHGYCGKPNSGCCFKGGAFSCACNKFQCQP